MLTPPENTNMTNTLKLPASSLPKRKTEQNVLVMLLVGLEPTMSFRTEDSESSVFTNFTTTANKAKEKDSNLNSCKRLMRSVNPVLPITLHFGRQMNMALIQLSIPCISTHPKCLILNPDPITTSPKVSTSIADLKTDYPSKEH